MRTQIPICHFTVCHIICAKMLLTSKINADNDCLTELKDILGSRLPLFEPVHRSTGFDRSSAMGKATLDAFPDTPGVAVYHHIANELLRHGDS